MVLLLILGHVFPSSRRGGAGCCVVPLSRRESASSGGVESKVGRRLGGAERRAARDVGAVGGRGAVDAVVGRCGLEGLVPSHREETWCLVEVTFPFPAAEATRKGWMKF